MERGVSQCCYAVVEVRKGKVCVVKDRVLVMRSKVNLVNDNGPEASQRVQVTAVYFATERPPFLLTPRILALCRSAEYRQHCECTGLPMY